DPEKYVYKSRKGLDREIVEMISSMKDEPEWMRAYRLHSLEHFQQRPLPTWGANLAQIDFNDIYYYLKPTEKKQRSWDEVPEDNKLASLNSAVWSGGSFVYVPEGVHVDIPLQAYFRINAQNMGQFERTLIICEPGSYVHYVEGCTAPIYTTDSLHSAVVEIIVKEGARCRYTTIQNWSTNTYNLVTKRAVAYRDATMEWVDGNLG